MIGKGRFKSASGQMRQIELLAEKDSWLNRIHPLCKFLVTMLYIVLVVSVHRYDLNGLLGMCVYPIVLFVLGEISVTEGLYRLRIVLPMVCFIGIFNPFFDREAVFYIEGFSFTGRIAVTSGVISMFTLMLKGILTVLAAYLLVATTTIDKICSALRMLHVPRILVTVVLLIYRYASLLSSEVRKMSQAYALRAPGHKGINPRVWGSFAGLLLIRSIDRAQIVYESMLLRGFQGEFNDMKNQKLNKKDYLFFGGWCAILVAIRILM